MSDLISRSAIHNKICKRFNIPKDWDGDIAKPLQTVLDLIENEDCAYDVDAVAEQVLEITRRIFNYCEEIDNNIPVDERTGYDMLADINLLRDVVIKGDVLHKITQTNDSNAAYIKGIDVCAKAFLDLVAYTNSELKEINEMLEKLKAGEADA